MRPIDLISKYTLRDCLERFRLMTETPIHIPSQWPDTPLPIRISLAPEEIERTTRDSSHATLSYQSTLSGWRFNYIPLWVMGTLSLEFTARQDGTVVSCTSANRSNRVPQMVPLEMAWWFLIVFVQGTFIYRAIQEPSPNNLGAVIIFAIVPLFFIVTKILLHRGTSAALEEILRRTLEK